MVPSEVAFAGVYVPPLLVATVIGLLLATLTARLASNSGVSGTAALQVEPGPPVDIETPGGTDSQIDICCTTFGNICQKRAINRGKHVARLARLGINRLSANPHFLWRHVLGAKVIDTFLIKRHFSSHWNWRFE